MIKSKVWEKELREIQWDGGLLERQTLWINSNDKRNQLFHFCKYLEKE